ncbi:TauD/TfdA family dioxygenase [Halotia branconii]|uniref:TauD/TfdA family dioxygenase n=1 Tax=Halotia branconii CENA392 TaxID=1539056 RepID=A0AAJ6P8D8_9CYAN|nr:TauD/TfdA family dioxygenase [Halotia branconii]WGV24585.1 TauD/TfdA family dioxygenase [Halotia branconii CENA392]
MNNTETMDVNKPSFKKMWADKKQKNQPVAINLSSQGLVDVTHIQAKEALPLIIQPKFKDLNLQIWSQNNRDFIETNLLKYGGILFRGFDISTQDDFEGFVNVVCPQIMNYVEGATPRTKLSNKVYTSTEFPPEHSIALHNELSYVITWPMKIWFCCIQPATVQGETPIADMRKVYQKISPQIRERFQEKGWMLVRNFGNGFGLPWQRSFATNDKADLAEYCRHAQIEFEWQDENHLKTHQVRPAIAQHPVTGDMVWFNHIVFWHVSSLEADFRNSFLSENSEENLPYNTYYGDGSPIETSVIEEIRAVIEQETKIFPWQKGDILMLDNMLVSHGRRPFSGARKILTAMGEPSSTLSR